MKSTIITPTNNLSESISFYERLSYTKIAEKEAVFFTDGSAIIEVNPERTTRPGVKLYSDSWDEQLKALNAITTIYSIPNGHLINDGSGCWIYLIEGTLDVPEVSAEPAIPGNFAGLSMEGTEIHRSFDIWQILGFETTMGSLESSYVVMMNEDGFGVSLMKPLTCPHLFFNPSMTFFNGGKNLPIVEKIRKAGIPIAEEITQFNPDGIADNIIIRDPGGFGFFVFND